jgi:hypothetical protein
MAMNRGESIRFRRTLLAAAFAVTHACANAPEDGGAVEVRDSAGVRVVVSHAPVSARPWTVGLQPLVEIGGYENDTTQTLFRVEAALVLDDGRIVLAHAAPPMIRLFDAAGRYQHGTGRAGGGPGEFASQRVTSMWQMPGDSVATWEHSLRRMQVFDPAGSFARAVVLELPPDLPPRAFPQMVGPLHDGFVGFVATPWEPGALGEVTRERLTYVRHDAEGRYAGEIARLPGFTSFTSSWVGPDGAEQRIQSRQPFGPMDAAWPAGDALIYGSADRYELAVYDEAGSLRKLIRRTAPLRPVTADLIAAHKAETMARAPADPATRRSWEESVNSAPHPASLPAYRRIRGDRSRMLWVQEYDVPGDAMVTWSIFDAEGRWLADAALPAAWRVLDIGDDYILALVRNELDVETVRRHPLERP